MKKILMIMFGLVAFNINAQAADVTDVTAINDFKPAEYLGEWYEIARIPFYFEEQCKAPVKAVYAQSGDDISVTNSCMTDSGKTDVSNGMAYFVESQNVAKLKVTFVPSWLRFTHIGRGDYWVLYTDYNYSLVGAPNHKYLWILSRNESADVSQVTKLLSIAHEQEFDTNKLVFNYPQFESLIDTQESK